MIKNIFCNRKNFEISTYEINILCNSYEVKETFLFKIMIRLIFNVLTCKKHYKKLNFCEDCEEVISIIDKTIKIK